MKVLFVSNGFPPRGQWGTEYYTHQLVTGLAGRGIRPQVLHPERDGSQPRYTLEETRSGDVPVHLLHNPGDPGKSFRDSYENERVEELFRALLERERPDLVHFTYLLWGLSVRMPAICRELGIPCVLTLTDYSLICHRGQMFDWRLRQCGGPHPAAVCARCIREPAPFDDTPAMLALRRAAARGLAAVGGLGKVVVARDLERREGVVREALAAADHLIAPTSVLAEAFQRAGVSAAKLTRLCYAIDPEPFAVAREQPDERAIHVGFLGQFRPHKGLGTLLEAAEIMSHRLPESVEPWELRLYGAPGGGRHRLYADAILGRVHNPRVVVHEPFAPDRAPEVLADLHAVVVPSEWDENAPLTCLQARAAEVPVVGSDVRGVTEVIEHGVHGLIFPAGNATALADALREVILKHVRRTGRHDLPSPLPEHLDRIQEIYASLARG